MRRRRQEADADVARVLAAGLSGIPPEQITQWTLIIIDKAGDGFVYSSACCANHAGETLTDVIEPRLAALPPCRGRDG